jgi:membrane associated rhomboid family serine protease
MINYIKKLFYSDALNTIIKINIVVYIIQCLILLVSTDVYNCYILLFSLHSDFLYDIMIPLKFITHGFIHNDISHIVGNIITILLNYWIFAKIKDYKIWFIYIISVLFSGLSYIIFINLCRMDSSILLGSSGAISGLLTYSYLIYNKKIIFDLEMKHILFLYLVSNIFSLFVDKTIGTGIAHLSGMFIGYLFYLCDNKKGLI